ncbi:MAG TPA: nuclear transport factor 2 family protein [Deltaproteobacteria bacterium]|nr:nuclear transport factor 2 family protein [Deltaproteobacteria bacterium]
MITRLIPGALCIFIMVLAGCSGSGTRGVHDIAITYSALRDTEPGRISLVEHGSDLEKKAIERFKEYYAVFSPERITQSTDDLYAQDAYFEDGIRQVRGRQNIKEYFLSTTEAFDECTFEVWDVGYSEGNYYFRWIMHLKLKRYGDAPLELPGMSHVRFDDAGQVVFHHDYWETLALFERFPLIGGIIAWIKKRI